MNRPGRAPTPITQVLLCLFALVGLVRSAPAADDAISPDKVIPLFNGKDLTPFYTWDVKHGRDHDVDRVFTVVERVDDAPAIRISGQHFGGIVPRKRYKNYRFVADFRWGLLTWQPRRDKTRDGGVLFHCQGEIGNNQPDRKGAYMESVEYQIIEGGTGDLILVRGYYPGRPMVCPTLHTNIVPGTRRWDPNGTPIQLKEGFHRTDWQHKSPEWTDVLGFRGPRDAEKPVGQWNRLEAIVEGGNVTFFLNGVKVNEGRDGSHTEGPILIQSEGAEIFFRNVELHPLK
jgi:hypothetical protein